MLLLLNKCMIIRFVDFSFDEMRIYSRREFSFIFSLIYDDFFNGFIKKLQVEISSFLTGMAFPVTDILNHVME